jgi:hypothetical protein
MRSPPTRQKRRVNPVPVDGPKKFIPTPKASIESPAMTDHSRSTLFAPERERGIE